MATGVGQPQWSLHTSTLARRSCGHIPEPSALSLFFLFIIIIEQVLVSQTVPLHLLGGDPVLQVWSKDYDPAHDAGVGGVALCPLPQFVAGRLIAVLFWRGRSVTSSYGNIRPQWVKHSGPGLMGLRVIRPV